MTCIEVGVSTVTATFSAGPGAAEREKKDFQVFNEKVPKQSLKPKIGLKRLAIDVSVG